MRLIFWAMVAMASVEAKISDNFYNFMVQRFGQQFADTVVHRFQGPFGSWGGGNHVPGTKTKHLPVVFVHGLILSGYSYVSIAEFWRAMGYDWSELYLTSYGETPNLVGLATLHVALRCEYARTVRNLIIAVSAYTDSRVNVIAYSMGGPVSRKAILGGPCVEDPSEDLGPPLTNYVETYLAVVGANKGAMLCPPVSFVCSSVNGMLCGSKYMQDINSKQHYEGQKVFAIQSTADEIVGFLMPLPICNMPASIPGADKVVTVHGYPHAAAVMMTIKSQYDLVTTGRYNWWANGLL